ncbi:MAG: hypothetical protein KBD56_05725 [Candidatus Eisenbacteria bacterium]|nr:hypothetical protein [Candidatus Eisenbacteria bacterium]
MKKATLAILIAAIAILLGSSGYLYYRYQQTSLAYTETKAAEEEVRGHFDEAITAIAEIQTNLNAIDLEESEVSLLSPDLENGVTASRKEQIVGRITDLRQSVEQSKEKIRQLESSLRDSQVKVGDLEKIIVGLKESVAQKERNIQLLTTRVEALRVQVAGLETTVRERESTIAQRDETIQIQQQTLEERRRELSTIYYVVGTKDDLREKGIIVEHGGVLGIGKTTQLSASFDPDLFLPLDTDQSRVIRVPSLKFQVLSPQVRTSYSVHYLQDQAELTILDRNEFRKVKYLVIMVA